jgi:hypothetical protein
MVYSLCYGPGKKRWGYWRSCCLSLGRRKTASRIVRVCFDESVSSRSQFPNKISMFLSIYNDNRWEVDISSDANRRTFTRNYHSWHVLKFLIELGVTQVFVRRTCPGRKVFALLYVPTCVVKLFLGGQKVKFSEHNQDGH